MQYFCICCWLKSILSLHPVSTASEVKCTSRIYGPYLEVAADRGESRKQPPLALPVRRLNASWNALPSQPTGLLTIESTLNPHNNSPAKKRNINNGWRIERKALEWMNNFYPAAPLKILWREKFHLLAPGPALGASMRDIHPSCLECKLERWMYMVGCTA